MRVAREADAAVSRGAQFVGVVAVAHGVVVESLGADAPVFADALEHATRREGREVHSLVPRGFKLRASLADES